MDRFINEHRPVRRECDQIYGEVVMKLRRTYGSLVTLITESLSNSIFLDWASTGHEILVKRRN